jgi:hypothetical protein
MATRRTLKAVAHDVSESLVSRNDDLGGYWAMGQLLSHALKTGSTRYTFDLACADSTPKLATSALSSIPAAWADTFWKNLEHQKLSRALVARATATLTFDLTQSQPSPHHEALEEHAFSCTVEIQDDRGSTHVSTTQGWCFPHNPRVELRSTRGA